MYRRPSTLDSRAHGWRGAAGLLCAIVLVAGLGVPASAEDPIHPARARRLARDVQPALVRIHWRPRDGSGPGEDRHAVVIDPEGWLLLAGPRPSPEGTLAAVFENGRAMRADVWASDARTCLTLLRVPATRLPPLSLRDGGLVEDVPAESAPNVMPLAPEPTSEAGTEDAPLLPRRLAPGFPFLLVTAPLGKGQGPSVARGVLRGSHRRRAFEDAIDRVRVDVTCLDEAGLAVLPTDLGAPWLDEDGRIIGLLVGAALEAPAPKDDPDDIEMRPEVTAAYAVPAEVIRAVWPLLRVHRRVPRARLGAYVGRLSDAVRDQLCPGCGGFEVLDLAKRGPASLGQVMVADIIRTVNGYRMAPDADLSDILLPHRPGEQIQIEVLRRGEPVHLDVVLGTSD